MAGGGSALVPVIVGSTVTWWVCRCSTSVAEGGVNAQNCLQQSDPASDLSCGEGDGCMAGMASQLGVGAEASAGPAGAMGHAAVHAEATTGPRSRSRMLSNAAMNLTRTL